MDSYLTIGAPGEGVYREKGSRFLAFAMHVEDEEEIKEAVAALKKKYFDARHHCYAWRLGWEGDRTRAVDDGEPSSTAGKPILGQIVSAQLTNVLVVVVRYFGGTKLGTPGLIRAYREAAAEAIAAAERVERRIEAHLTVTFGYEAMNGVMKVVKDMAPTVTEQDFGNVCRMELAIRRDEQEQLAQRLAETEGVEVIFNKFI